MSLIVMNSVDLLMAYRNISRTEELYAFESKLGTRTRWIIKKIVNEGISVDTLYEVFDYLFKLSEKIGDTVIMECIGHLSMQNDEIYRDFVMEYIESSNKMLNFCSELEMFLSSAGDRHSYIVHTTQPWINRESDVVLENVMMILEVLKNLKASDVYEQSAGNLLEKVQILIQQQQQMYLRLNQHIQTLCEENQTTRDWIKVTSIISVASTFTLLIGMIVSLVAAPPAFAVAFAAGTVGMAVGGYWVCDLFQAYEAALLVQTEAVNSMIKKGNMIVIMELQDIERLIKTIVHEINSLGEKVGFAAQGNVSFAMKDMKQKLDEFSKKIENMKAKTAACSSNIMRAREEIRSTLNSNSYPFTGGELVDNTSSS